MIISSRVKFVDLLVIVALVTLVGLFSLLPKISRELFNIRLGKEELLSIPVCLLSRFWYRRPSLSLPGNLLFLVDRVASLSSPVPQNTSKVPTANVMLPSSFFENSPDLYYVYLFSFTRNDLSSITVSLSPLHPLRNLFRLLYSQSCKHQGLIPHLSPSVPHQCPPSFVSWYACSTDISNWRSPNIFEKKRYLVKIQSG